MKGVSKILNNKYTPKWKMELEQEKKKITEEVTEKVTEEVTQEITKFITKNVTEKIESTFIRLMKENGIPENLIRTIAIQGNVPIKIVNSILENDNDKQI